MTTNGVIFISYGAKFATEAARSTTSIKKLMPDLPITLFTETGVSGAPFDSVVEVEPRPYHRTCKPRNMAQTPYERTLYLDTDTFVCGDIRPLFALLDEFDFAAAHDPERVRAKDAQMIPDIIQAVPLPFAQFNSGVILYKKSAQMIEFLAKWVGVIERHEQIAKQRGMKRALEQTALREAIYASPLRVATLTPEYNCRGGSVGFLEGAVKILHGRSFDFERRAAELNRSLYKRVFIIFPTGVQVIAKREATGSKLGPLGQLRLRLFSSMLNRLKSRV